MKKELSKKLQKTKLMILNDVNEWDLRMHMMKQVLHDDSESSYEIIGSILKDAAAFNGSDLYAEKNKFFKDSIAAMEQGPLRIGVCSGVMEYKGIYRARVVLEDGSAILITVPEENLLKTLTPGTKVIIDSAAKAVLDKIEFEDGTGEVLQFDHRLDERHVAVTSHGDSTEAFLASREVIDAMNKDKVVYGSKLLVSSRQKIVRNVLASDDELENFRFLDRSPVSSIGIDKIANTPEFIGKALRHIEQVMTNPKLRSQYRLPKCLTILLEGISGGGKTYSVLHAIKLIYQLLSKITGDPLDQLPPLVMRLRGPLIYSKWIGESEKNIDHFFKEAEKLANRTYVAANGKKFTLPVLIVIEEIDGMASERGHEPVMDRIFTTLIERLDPTRLKQGDPHMLIFSTTIGISTLWHAERNMFYLRR